MKTSPREGVVKEEKLPNTRKPSHQQVYGEFGNLKGHHNQEGKKKKKKTQNMCFNHNSQQRNSPDARVCHRLVGEAWVARLG